MNRPSLTYIRIQFPIRGKSPVEHTEKFENADKTTAGHGKAVDHMCGYRTKAHSKPRKSM